MVSYDLLNQHDPEFDVTLLFYGNWGIRYSVIDHFKFLHLSEADESSFKDSEFEGNIKLPILLKTIDYKTFGDTKGKIFDFITAYAGLGYNHQELKLTQDQYDAQASTLQKSTRSETVQSSLTALTFGFYGGESFLVIDLRLLFLMGKTEASSLVDQQNNFSNWLMTMSVGIGF